MKKETIFCIFGALILTLSSALIPPKHNMVGRWKANLGNGPKVLLDFSKKGGVQVLNLDGSVVLGGEYKLNDDVVSLADSTCGTQYWSRYKFTFYQEDSMSSEVIEDSCSIRRANVDKATYKRVQPK